MKKLPVKLDKEPLIDVNCEFAVAPSAVGLITLLPSALHAALKDEIKKVEMGQMSRQINGAAPETIPAARLILDQFSINVSQQTFSVSASIPYVGWPAYKGMILRIVQIAVAAGLVSAVTRYSMKYTNFFPLAIDGPDVLDVKVQFGDGEPEHQPTLALNTAITRDGFTSLLRVAATAQKFDNGVVIDTGALVDVDTIAEFAQPYVVADDLESRLDALRLESKKVFFESIKQGVIDARGPTY